MPPGSRGGPWTSPAPPLHPGLWAPSGLLLTLPPKGSSRNTTPRMSQPTSRTPPHGPKQDSRRGEDRKETRGPPGCSPCSSMTSAQPHSSDVRLAGDSSLATRAYGAEGKKLESRPPVSPSQVVGGLLRHTGTWKTCPSPQSQGLRRKRWNNVPETQRQTHGTVTPPKPADLAGQRTPGATGGLLWL